MTLYGYARVSGRKPEDKNLHLRVERLVRVGCPLGNIRAEEASGAKNDRGGLLELLDLVIEGDTLVVTHIDRLSRGLTCVLQVIDGLHLRGIEFRSLAEDFHTSTASGKLQLTMILAFSEWWRNSIRERSIAGQHQAREGGGTALLKAAVQWRNEAQQYATAHGKPPMDRPAQGPWRMEVAEAEDHAKVRFLRTAQNYVWAKALGWDAEASGGRLLNAALRLPAPQKQKKRKPEAA